MDFSADDDRLCKEPGDAAFLQMMHHEVAHAIASHLVGVLVGHLKVSQRLPVNQIDRLFENGGCSFCNSVPGSYDGAHWHEKALIKRAGHIGEARYCNTAKRELSVPSADNAQLEILFGNHAFMGEPTKAGKNEFNRFVHALDNRLTEWFDAPDVKATFDGLVRLIMEKRINQGDEYYTCELAGPAVESGTADLPIARHSLIDWP